MNFTQEQLLGHKHIISATGNRFNLNPSCNQFYSHSLASFGQLKLLQTTGRLKNRMEKRKKTLLIFYFVLQILCCSSGKAKVFRTSEIIIKTKFHGTQSFMLV